MIVVYTIDTTKQIDWSAKGNDRIVQNVLNILNTRVYEIAYGRLMGISSSHIDMPVELAEAKVSADVLEILSRYEPRVTVKSIDFIGFSNEEINLRLVIEL